MLWWTYVWAGHLLWSSPIEWFSRCKVLDESFDVHCRGRDRNHFTNLILHKISLATRMCSHYGFSFLSYLNYRFILLDIDAIQDSEWSRNCYLCSTMHYPKWLISWLVGLRFAWSCPSNSCWCIKWLAFILQYGQTRSGSSYRYCLLLLVVLLLSTCRLQSKVPWVCPGVSLWHLSAENLHPENCNITALETKTWGSLLFFVRSEMVGICSRSAHFLAGLHCHFQKPNALCPARHGLVIWDDVWVRLMPSFQNRKRFHGRKVQIQCFIQLLQWNSRHCAAHARKSTRPARTSPRPSTARLSTRSQGRGNWLSV